MTDDSRFDLWLTDVAGEVSALEGKLVEITSLDLELAKSSFNAGLSANQFARMIYEQERQSRQEAIQQAQAQAVLNEKVSNAKITLWVYGLAFALILWYCGGMFGVPLGPTYVSPEQKEKARIEREAEDQADAKKYLQKLDEEAKRKDPYTYVKLSEFEIVRENYGASIVQKVKNISSKTLQYVSITYTLKNKAGEKIGTAIDNTSLLAPGQVWKSKASIVEEEAQSFELEEISVLPAE